MSELKDLVEKLKKQVNESQKTYEKIAEAVKSTEDHALKFYALTSLGQHFGSSGVLQAIEKLNEKVNKE